MKYVMFEQDHFLHPIIFADHTTHSQIAVLGTKPRSAGFLMIKNGRVETYGKSDSLNLKPHPRDAEVLTNVIMNLGVYGFVDYG